VGHLSIRVREACQSFGFGLRILAHLVEGLWFE
jgi:hypothetical protein